MNPEKDWQKRLLDYIKDATAGDSTGHDFYHAIRVKRLAVLIGQDENADFDVLIAAAYLHDIGRGEERLVNDRIVNDHVTAGMRRTREILPRVGFPEDKIERVVECIRDHEHYQWDQKGKSRAKLSKEALILQDADRLDAIGAIGIARAFAYGGAIGRPLWNPEEELGEFQHGVVSRSTLHHFHEKLLRLKDIMNTDLGRRLAAERHAYIEEFLARFEREWEGKETENNEGMEEKPLHHLGG